MERQTGWPERFTIIRPLATIERLLGRIASREIPNTGAGVMLDEGLDEAIDLRDSIPESTRVWLDHATNEQ